LEKDNVLKPVSLLLPGFLLGCRLLEEFWFLGEIQNFFHKLRIPYFFFVLFLLVSLFAFINMIVYE